MPTAISQLQLEAAPAITATVASASQNLQLLRIWGLLDVLVARAGSSAANFAVTLVTAFSFDRPVVMKEPSHSTTTGRLVRGGCPEVVDPIRINQMRMV